MADSAYAQQTRLVEQLFVRHVSTIRGFIEAFVPDFNRADDILQECFLTVAAKAGDFREGSDFVAWALAIAKFKVLESGHRPGVKVNSLSAEVIETLAAEPLPESASDDCQAWLRECIEELSPRSREVIDLRYGESCRPAEIAQRLHWTPESVYVALSRARSLLRECLERKTSEEHRS
jgi:RNA polymerase sigma-70 factor (ECF subfamily)